MLDPHSKSPFAAATRATSRTPANRLLAIACAVALASAAAFATSGCGADNAASVTPPEYVALGDSYTAGTGIKPQATKFVPDGCRQSLINYPHLVARQLAFVAFADASCGGAQVKDMAGSQDTGDGVNAPQLDRVDDETLYVTLSVGGNDTGFGDVVDTCLRNTNPNANPCVDRFAADGSNQLVENAVNLREGVEQTVGQIRQRAPRAKVVIVGYPQLLPPGARGCGNDVGVPQADAVVINLWLRALNTTLRKAAANTGAEYVDLYGPSAGHDACQPRGERWMEPGSGTDGADPFHPNEAGQQAAAQEVSNTLERLSGPSGETGATK